MQKKIIALAVAGLASTAAFAQTNVTIYGVADAAFTYTGTNGGNRANTAPEQHGRDRFQIQSGGLGGSRLGFKGTEDLGNGLKAVFVLEYALSIDAGAGTAPAGIGNSRQQYVGLSSKMGDVTLGQQYAPGYYITPMDALATSPVLSPVLAAQLYTGATINGSQNARWNNSVNYKTANYGGFTAQAIYAMGENTNELAMGESYGIGADYAAGPFAVKYVYHKASPVQQAATSATAGVVDEHYVGASYDLKVVKLMGSAQMLDAGNKQFAGQGRSSAVYQFGAVVPVGKGNIHAGYAYADADSAPASTYNGSSQNVSVAYTHGLSKRTTLYTGVRFQSNDSRNAANNATQPSGETTAFAAGINHTF
jgi:predicted porin